MAVVSSDGTVPWIRSIAAEVSCVMDLTDFPHDEQPCALTMNQAKHLAGIPDISDCVLEQECISVGCVPSAAVAISIPTCTRQRVSAQGGCLPMGCLPRVFVSQLTPPHCGQNL